MTPTVSRSETPALNKRGDVATWEQVLDTRPALCADDVTLTGTDMITQHGHCYCSPALPHVNSWRAVQGLGNAPTENSDPVDWWIDASQLLHQLATNHLEPAVNKALELADVPGTFTDKIIWSAIRHNYVAANTPEFDTSQLDVIHTVTITIPAAVVYATADTFFELGECTPTMIHAADEAFWHLVDTGSRSWEHHTGTTINAARAAVRAFLARLDDHDPELVNSGFAGSYMETRARTRTSADTLFTDLTSIWDN